jgi:hypothetical protein
VPRESLALAAVAVIVASLLGSKVLSMQYALWLIPPAMLLPARLRWPAVAFAALSTGVFTFDYIGLWHFETIPILLMLVRNAALLWLAWAVASELWRRTGQADAA